MIIIHNAGDLGLTLGFVRSSGEGKGYPLQYSCLENSTDSIVHGVTKSWTRLNDFHFLISSTYPQKNWHWRSMGLLSASQVALVVKNPPANAGDIRDVGSIPGSEDSPGGGHAIHSSILAWRIPLTEETGRLQSTELQWVGYDWSNLACI